MNPMPVSVGRALGWGFAVALAATVAMFTAAFTGGLDIDLPGILEVNSSPETDGPPQTSMLFNPLAPVVLALAVAALIWSVSRIRHRARAGRVERG
jgi:hypothetical protein